MKEQLKKSDLKKKRKYPTVKHLDYRILNKNIDYDKLPLPKVEKRVYSFLDTEKDVKAFCLR